MATQIFSTQFGINRLYVIKDKGAILIDSGQSKKGKAFRRFLERVSIDPNEIKLIVLTHGDFDHVGSAGEIKEITGAQIAIHEADKVNLEESRFHWPQGVTVWGKISHGLFAPLMSNLAIPHANADIVLGAADYPLETFGIDGKIVYTPGHTRGSVSVVLETGEAFVGCMAHNYPLFRFRPGLPIYADDIEEVKTSWKKLFAMGVKTIYPGHGNSFNVEVMRKVLRY